MILMIFVMTLMIDDDSQVGTVSNAKSDQFGLSQNCSWMVDKTYRFLQYSGDSVTLMI